jgi:4-hydroxy-tetrahydrodipicolinate synthase
MRFRSDPATIRGAITPLVTPFTSDGGLDLESIARLVQWQLQRGAHGISVGGSTGEPSAQTVAERTEVMRTAATAVADRVPFMPGTGTARLDETLELTAAADELGADAVLVITPYYARPTQEGLYQWYSTVAQEFPSLPIVLYNVPVRTAVDIAPGTVARLAREHENIVGIKETTKDFEHVSHVLSLCGADFLAYSGIELLCYPMLALGGAGHLSCVANFAPEPVAQLYDHFTAGRHAEARALHYRLHPLVELAFLETNPVPAKWAMAELGILRCAHARPPLTPLSEASREKARALLAESRDVEAPIAAR